MSLPHSGNGSSRGLIPSEPLSSAERRVLPEETFKRMIAIERKRTERSRNPFLLMLLETGKYHASEKNGKVIANILVALLESTRETDVIGWYEDRSSVGAMFTELGAEDRPSILSTMLSRVSAILQDKLTFEQFNQVSISFHFFPDKWDDEVPQRPSNPILYPDLSKRDDTTRFFSGIKRVMDIIGGALILLCCSPVFLVIALAIKVSSKGPVFFRQRRVGQYGKPFTFLKFRSMYIDNDSGVHREYVTKLIAGHAELHPTNGNGNANGNGDGTGVYKLTNDSRITRVGAFLRRTSLDELPQVLNVLTGEMSLVGPRPALPYEVAAYQTWHRRRILEVKPGITGLWQVSGRCRVRFDEAVRLDIRYARNWSPWLDIKILVRTPKAVFSGEGAY